jgi:hypothetical protein
MFPSQVPPMLPSPSPRSPSIPLTLLLGVGWLWGCGGGGTEPSIPGAITVSPTSVQFQAVGESRQLTATVTDQAGAPISSPTVSWTSSDAGVARVSSTGLVSSQGSGSAEITATAGAVTASATVTVSQTPASIEVAEGNQQSVTVGQAVPVPLTVQVNDAAGNPVAGATVEFTVDPAAGQLGTPSALTGADGRAATAFTVLASGDVQVTAAVAGTSLATTFTETGLTAFAIELQFLTAPSPAQRQAFVLAQQRWQRIIVGDLPAVQLNAAAGKCGANSPAVNRSIDDLLILITLEPIDGNGGVLGAAGPCFVRTGTRLPVMGSMKFDTADLNLLEQNNLLQPVILHEMGHVLGFGTIWSDLNLLSGPALSGGNDPHFTGPAAIAAFDQVGGSSYAGGAKVPVEDTGGEGTADAHWRETVFGTELMTGFVDQNPDPLSIVSIASMGDLGYTVNQAEADPFSLATALRALARGPRFSLGNDRLRLPLHVVAADGRVVEVVQP